ncbi:hypothetical protein CHGG_00397 [Chaetomium globosum CBS 148.51]|uniref:Mannose-1-phosphate guanyltransferase n=1 Tax=Chaetomium globosum (strain ATCC 6205 / CBS 148.51 / DSM 1962 / NBRC 6347 / NRRL 1970) TaxID=306901 RepID=Q2HHA7_CHAGB|nr:uncharacterized protein CHGG_00397 [Chaetomium globosum CBS 148.51]EAQ92162.1 hypothetical protein CHGG_00397 [Chaetomium globosum CBS 148.51]
MSKQGGKGGAAAGKAKKPAKAGTDEKREDVLQAVILADSFQDRFKPFTLETPRCLLPLVNVPVIEYTLEFLASNGVQEVFIYCGTHSESIENYINESTRWSPGSVISPFSSLEFIRVSDANSIGDFLRDLDKRSIIGGDFILVHGDVVSNIQLDTALAKHRARREANRDACMTVVLRSVGEQPHRAAKARGITPVFIVDPTTGRCLQYEETHPLQSEHYLNLDPAVFSHGQFEIRTDLVDCGIDICTPDDWELNGKMLYAEILDDGYAARATNLQIDDFDGAKLEFMGLRLANNASDGAMRRAIAVAFVRRAAELLTPEHGALEPTKAASEALTAKNGAVKFVREVGVGGEGVAQQAEFALALQKALTAVKGLEPGRSGALLAALLQQLYSLDVLEEEGILAWWADKRAAENEGLDALRQKCRVLVEWLENADEEESSEEEDDEDESD